MADALKAFYDAVNGRERMQNHSQKGRYQNWSHMFLGAKTHQRNGLFNIIENLSTE